ENVNKESHTRDVAARSAQTGDQAIFYRVVPHRDHERDSRGSGLGRKPCDSATRRSDNGNLPAYQLGCQRWKLVVSARRPSEFNGDIPPLDIAGLFEAIAKRRHQWCK